MSSFTLDHRLESDCLLIGDLPLCRLLLLNDNRWPWFILVPRVADAVEIFRLTSDQQIVLHQEISSLAQITVQLDNVEKINTGALGNIVRQLHVHIIGRHPGDANWPGPVWGFGEKRPYSNQAAQQLIENAKNRLQLV